MSNLPEITAIHGFLGRPSDWDRLPWSPDTRSRLVTHDLFAQIPSGDDAFNAWAADFLPTVQSGSVLLGYSLGARLAMHAALMDPSKFSAVVLIAGHPGLASEAEKSQRLASDLAWSKRFGEEPWSNVITSWNSQAVFSSAGRSPDAIPLSREERDFSRERLAQAMDVWSLGRQEDLALKLSRLEIPTLLVSGEADTKFTSLMRGLGASNPRFESRIVAQAGHRVPWDAPVESVAQIEDFLARHTP